MSEFNGVLEVDEERGVIYFHNARDGRSVLRLQGLPAIPWTNDEYGHLGRYEGAKIPFLDLKWPERVSWDPAPDYIHGYACGCITTTYEVNDGDHEYQTCERHLLQTIKFCQKTEGHTVRVSRHV